MTLEEGDESPLQCQLPQMDCSIADSGMDTIAPEVEQFHGSGPLNALNHKENVASFDGHIGAVTAISFSENGYFLATAAQDGVKLWDLCRLKIFRTFAPYDENTPAQSGVFESIC